MHVLKYFQLPALSVQLIQNVQIILHASEKNAKTHVLLAPVALMLNVKRNDIVLYAIVNQDMKEILTEFVKNVRIIELDSPKSSTEFSELYGF